MPCAGMIGTAEPPRAAGTADSAEAPPPPPHAPDREEDEAIRVQGTGVTGERVDRGDGRGRTFNQWSDPVRDPFLSLALRTSSQRGRHTSLIQWRLSPRQGRWRRIVLPRVDSSTNERREVGNRPNHSIRCETELLRRLAGGPLDPKGGQASRAGAVDVPRVG